MIPNHTQHNVLCLIPSLLIVTAILCTATSYAQILPGEVQALNSNASSNLGEDLLPTVATDGGGNWVTVWQSSEDLFNSGTDREIYVSRSTDNGATWTAAALLNSNAISDSGHDTRPSIATDSKGRWIVLWQSMEDLSGAGLDMDIFVASSTDNGLTWSAPTVLHSAFKFDTGWDYLPRLSTDCGAIG